MTRKVLISPNFGAGWSTWNSTLRDDFLFDAELIRAVESREPLGYGYRGSGTETTIPGSPLAAFVERLVAKHGPEARHAYLGGSTGLTVVSVEGPFRVTEYDGAEAIETRDTTEWL
jgi:hypothetical protein